MKRNQKTKESLTNPENKPKATEMNKIIIILRTIPLMLVTMTLKLILQAGEWVASQHSATPIEAVIYPMVIDSSKNRNYSA